MPSAGVIAWNVTDIWRYLRSCWLFSSNARFGMLRKPSNSELLQWTRNDQLILSMFLCTSMNSLWGVHTTDKPLPTLCEKVGKLLNQKGGRLKYRPGGYTQYIHIYKVIALRGPTWRMGRHWRVWGRSEADRKSELEGGDIGERIEVERFLGMGIGWVVNNWRGRRGPLVLPPGFGCGRLVYLSKDHFLPPTCPGNCPFSGHFSFPYYPCLFSKWS